jgi:hypothetical protein
MTAHEGPLRRVVYVSHTLTDEAEMAATLDSILAAARRNNARAGVTGALLYSARRFAQVLEGPPEAVEEIFETIQCDPRHDQISVLNVTSPSVRAFADWSMAFAETPEINPADLDANGDAERIVGVLQAAIRNTEAATA